MHAKSSSTIETLRKPASRMIAVIFILVSLLTLPQAFGTVFGEVLVLCGYSLLIAAALGRVWCAIYISGRKDRELCQEGPYSLSRNPLYFFSLLGAVGFFAALANLAFAVAAAVVYLGYYRYVIRSEEQRLAQLFGTAYETYSQRTPRFFPALRAPQGIDSYTIRPKIIERALKEVVWFLLVIVFAEALESIHEAGHLVIFRLPF
jgi:protein-S-isoprenylcysteine O-methyltransferase Ste14